jgi:hypothetical protein
MAKVFEQGLWSRCFRCEPRLLGFQVLGPDAEATRVTTKAVIDIGHTAESDRHLGPAR